MNLPWRVPMKQEIPENTRLGSTGAQRDCRVENGTKVVNSELFQD
jgi:hypothetical protein